MANATLTFRPNEKKESKPAVWNVPQPKCYVIDLPKIKKSITSLDFLKNGGFVFAAAPVVASEGVFWDAFLRYIFPWMLDIAKVFCAIKIAQSFYEEKRGGREGGTGFSSVVQYGKWYLIFWMIPWSVELIDQIGGTMFQDLRNDSTTTFSEGNPYNKE